LQETYLNRSSTCNNFTISDSAFDDHDCVMQTPLYLLDKLIRATT
jgi:hypothetical protein